MGRAVARICRVIIYANKRVLRGVEEGERGASDFVVARAPARTGMRSEAIEQRSQAYCSSMWRRVIPAYRLEQRGFIEGRWVEKASSGEGGITGEAEGRAAVEGAAQRVGRVSWER